MNILGGKNLIISVSDDGNEITFEQDSAIKGVSTITIYKGSLGYEVLSSTNLINCVDCGHHLSVHSSTCVSCGCPINYSLETYFKTLVEEYNRKQREQQALQVARFTLFSQLKAIYIRKYDEEQKRLAVLKQKNDIISRLKELNYDKMSSVSVYMSLGMLEDILYKWNKVVEEKRLRKELIESIPETYINFLNEQAVNYNKYSYEYLSKLAAFCNKNKLLVEELIKKVDKSTIKVFCRIADTVIPNWYGRFNNTEERLKYLSDVAWKCYLRFLFMPDNYSDATISMGFVTDGDLIDVSFMRSIAEKVSEEMKEVQRKSLIVDKKNNEEFEKYYYNYLKVLNLTDYKTRKQIIKNYCVYTVLKSAIQEFKNGYTSSIFQVPLTTIFEVKKPIVYQKQEIPKYVPPKYEQPKPIHYDKINIKHNDKIIASNDGKCVKHHPTKRVDAQIQIELGDGKVVVKSYLMEYCDKCNIFYITDSVFKALIKQGVVYCNLYPDNDTYSDGCGYEGWAKQSLLNKCGYNVNASEGLTAKQRQDILVNVIKNKYYTSNEIVNFLRGLVERSRRVRDRDMSEAISKWQSDISFLLNLRRYRW